MPLDDKKTYRTLCNGNTTGVFQLESTGIREMTVKIRPNCFEDLVAILALYRPGPLDSGMAEEYIKRKHGKEKIKYLHPLLDTILKETYGVIVYQEQVMQISNRLGGSTAWVKPIFCGGPWVRRGGEEMAPHPGSAVEQGSPQMREESERKKGIFDLMESSPAMASISPIRRRTRTWNLT